MRTDIHTPSQIIPSDYNEIAVWTMNIHGIGDAQFLLQERETIRRHMASTGGTYAHVDTTGSCQVCGNVQAIYLVLFYHEKSNTYIRVGMDCATLPKAPKPTEAERDLAKFISTVAYA